jgi:hypothetical protein
MAEYARAIPAIHYLFRVRYGTAPIREMPEIAAAFSLP